MDFSWILDQRSPLFFIGATITLVGGILLVVHAFRLLPFWRRTRDKPSFILQAMKMLLSGIVFLVGLFLLSLILFAQTYEVLTREEPVARIQCASVTGMDYDMVMRFIPITRGEEGYPQLFRLNGDQWAVGGHILEWDPWLNILGLHTGYKVTRIEGRYLKAEDETTERRTVYDMGDPRTETVWHWLYRHYSEIPLVRAAYGNTTYTFPDKDQTYVVMVTRTGFKVTVDQKK
ncbi:MAG: hypothetical protein GTN81_08275 [Proteobacteria bacterium]|nr:hypothetical protein [Pseudomonadota bacterium]